MHISVRTFLISVALVWANFAHAQLPAPPPAPENGFPVPQLPKRMWNAGFNIGMVGFAPHQMNKISGDNHFTRTTNFGMGVVSDNRGRKRLSIIANTSLGLHAGITYRYKGGKQTGGFEVQFQQNKATYTFVTPFYFTYQRDTFARWVMTDKYLSYGVSYTHAFRRGPTGPYAREFWYTRIGFSQSFYHRNFGQKIELGTREDWTENGTGMRLETVKARRRSYLFSVETGRREYQLDYDRTLDFGVVAHLPLFATYTDQYEFFQNNTSVGKSTIEYTGAVVMLNLRYTFNGIPKPKDVDTTTPPPDYYATADTTREVDVQESFKVQNKRVKIIVWDRNEVDGDVVSLYMNNEMIKHKLRLRKHKRRFTVKLKPGSNIFVMYAENLGEIPPNTAAVVIKDGNKKRNVNLVSDNGKSGAIELIYEGK
jgi:hypothetical protein